MIVFRNPGLIDLDAVRTMGVNVKERPGAFGHFGTGLKFAIATVLRGGGSVTLYRGQDRHVFRTTERIIRGQPFHIVQMSAGNLGDPIDDDFDQLGFTDQLGKNWEPWMVLREFGCNTLDEGGTMERCQSLEDVPTADGETVFVVAWDALDEVFEARDSVFCGERPELMRVDQVQVLEGRSDHLFYRGVRVYRLEHPSVVTYNILSAQTLTEDRTIASFHFPMGEIRRMWLECDDKALLLQVLAPEGECFERTINYLETHREASRAFLDTVLDIRMDKELSKRLVKSAHDVLSRHLRSTKSSGIGWASSRFMQDEFSAAIEAMGEVFGDDELQLDKDLPLVMVEDDEIEGGGLVLLEQGRIYVARGLLRRGRVEIFTTLLPLIMTVRLGEVVYTADIARMIMRALVNGHPDLRDSAADRQLSVVLVDRDEEPEGRTMSVADELLVGMGVRGEEYPAFAHEPIVPPPAPDDEIIF